MIRLIHNTDLLQMLQLSVSEVLRLRLLSQKINIIILNANRFWERAFPGHEQPGSLYSYHVIELCHKRHLSLMWETSRFVCKGLSKEKASLKQKIERRQRLIEQTKREKSSLEDQLREAEMGYNRFAKQIGDAKDMLKKKGYKRSDIGRIESETQFKKQKWN